MKNQLFIAGSIALALAAGVMFLPSLSDAATRNRGGGGGGGYYAYCGPIQMTLGLCGSYGY